MAGVVSWWQQRKLHSRSTGVRVQAVNTLASRSSKSATSAVLEALADSDPHVRSAAAKSVGQRKDKHAAQPLCVLALYDNDRTVTADAVAALRSIGPQVAVPYLKTALDDPELAISRKAATLLHKMAWNCLDEAAKARIAVDLGLWSEACTLGEQAIAPLSAVIHSGTKRMKREAAEALAQIDTPQAFGALIDLLQDRSGDPEQREVVAWALHKYRAEEMSRVQGAVVSITLGAWSEVADYGEDALAPLAEAMKTGTCEVQCRAAKVLRRLKCREAVSLLEEALLNNHSDQRLRETVASILTKAEPPCAPRVWRQLLCDRNWPLRTVAAASIPADAEAILSKEERTLLAIARSDWETVVAAGPDAIPALVDSLQFVSITQSAAKALQRIGGPATQALIQVVRDGDQVPAIREIVASVLAEDAEPLAMEPLTQMLRDDDIAVRFSAVWSLERLGWQPSDGYSIAIQAMAHDDWAKLETLGGEAVEPIVRLVAQGMAEQEGLHALSAILRSSAGRISVPLLRRASLLSPADGCGMRGYSNTTQSDREACSQNYEVVRKLAKYELIRRGLAF